MPLTLTTPVVLSATTLNLVSCDINYQMKFMTIHWVQVDTEGKPLKSGRTLLRDIGEETTFSDFYNTWTTHQQLYDKISELENLAGSYSADGSIS